MAGISVGHSSAWKNVPVFFVGVSGAWKTVSNGWVGVGGVWKKFYTSVVPLSATNNVSALSGSGAHNVSVPIYTTSSVTCTASGGTPGYTYSWSRVSGDTSIFPRNGSSSTTDFGRLCAAAGTFIAVWRCTVTDSVPNSVAATPDVTITITAT